MPIVKIVNVSTGEEIEREMNQQELEEHEKRQIRFADELAQDEAKAEAKAALLEKLGITEDEAKLLLS